MKKPTWNIAFEISPILAASGSFGDKSGVYRINYNLIVSLSKYLIKNKLPTQIYLYLLAPHLAYSKNLDFSKLTALSNVHFIDVPFQIRPTLTEKASLDISVLRFLVKCFDLFIYRRILYHNNFYKYVDKIKNELHRYNVKILTHSENGHTYMKYFVNVIHINDLTAIKFPFWQRAETVETQKRKLRFARKFCQGIICISQHTKKDLIEYHHLTSSKLSLPEIRVIYLGGTMNQATQVNSPSFSDIQKIALPRTGNRLIAKQYFLYFGTIEPRKNLVSLISVFYSLHKEGKLKNYQLVLVGGRGWAKVHKSVKEFIVEHYPDISTSPIILLDFIGDEYLQSLIKNAYATVYPSHYEGFGLPILESMELATPVITSKTSSMPEVGGNACLYVDPTDPVSIRDALLKLVNDKNLRSELSVKALKQASKFSWDKCAKETYEFYSSLIEKNLAAKSR